MRGYGDLGPPLDIYEDPYADDCAGCPVCDPPPHATEPQPLPTPNEEQAP